jgi:hypothetical protein
MADRRLYKLHAAICHTLANPKRLEVIDTLRKQEMTVTNLALPEISQSNLSALGVDAGRGILTATMGWSTID